MTTNSIINIFQKLLLFRHEYLLNFLKLENYLILWEPLNANQIRFTNETRLHYTFSLTKHFDRNKYGFRTNTLFWRNSYCQAEKHAARYHSHQTEKKVVNSLNDWIYMIDSIDWRLKLSFTAYSYVLSLSVLYLRFSYFVLIVLLLASFKFSNSKLLNVLLLDLLSGTFCRGNKLLLLIFKYEEWFHSIVGVIAS